MNFHMKKLAKVLIAICVLSMIPFVSSAEADVEGQVQALQERLIQLEARVKALEAQTEKRDADLALVVESGVLEVQGPWEKLELGLDYARVMELLGKPVSKRKSAMAEYWYYSDKRSEGPFVKFIFSKVDGWKAP